MLQSILEMRSTLDFISVSRDLVSKSGKTQLYKDIAEAGLVFSCEVLWTPEELACYCRQSDGIDLGLRDTENEETPTKVIHRLQMVGAFNSGLRSYVARLISRVCV